MTHNVVYCFLDANVLIHFQTFDEVDWPSVLDARSVILVFAPSVLEELSKYKDDSSNERRRKRVRTLLAKLKLLLAATDPQGAAPLRAQTTIHFIATEPLLEWRAHGLDPSIGDDRLIASMLMFRQDSSEHPIMLMTNDFPALVKARSKAFEVVDPEVCIPAQELPSPETKRIKELEQQLYQVQQRLPKLSFGMWDGGKATQQYETGTRQPGTITTSLSDIGQRVRTMAALLKSKQEQAPSTSTAAERQEFQDDCAVYLRDHYLSLLRPYLRTSGIRVELGFILENTGTVMVSNLDVHLEFPLGSLVMGQKDEFDDVYGIDETIIDDFPPPRAPWERIRHSLSSVIAIPSRDRDRPSYPRGPLYRDHTRQRNHVWYEHDKLRAGTSWRLRPLVAYIPPEVGQGCMINYSAAADELAAMIEGTLHLRFPTNEGIT